jgi:SSS family solute:Na+ symporter
VSQLVTVGLMLVSIYVTLHLASIEQAWKLLIVTGAGTGTVLLLRWFWWRINAWSEVSAMAMAAAVSLYLQIALRWDSDRPRDFAYIMIVTVALTTIAWVAVTWMTAPEPDDTLRQFYRRVRPRGPGWKPIAERVEPLAIPGSLRRELACALLGCVLVYSALFGVGEILLRSVAIGVGLLCVSAISAYAVARTLDDEPART